MSEKLIEDVSANIFESKDRLLASVAIHNSRDAVRRKLAVRFLRALREKLEVISKGGWEVKPDEEGGYFSLSLRHPDRKGLYPTFQIGPDEAPWVRKDPQAYTPWHKTIGIGVLGGGQKANGPARGRAEDIEAEIKKALPRGETTDDWALFQHEFDHMDFEGVVSLLYDCFSSDVQRIAEMMNRIASVIGSEDSTFS